MTDTEQIFYMELVRKVGQESVKTMTQEEASKFARGLAIAFMIGYNPEAFAAQKRLKDDNYGNKGTINEVV